MLLYTSFIQLLFNPWAIMQFPPEFKEDFSRLLRELSKKGLQSELYKEVSREEMINKAKDKTQIVIRLLNDVNSRLVHKRAAFHLWKMNVETYAIKDLFENARVPKVPKMDKKEKGR